MRSRLFAGSLVGLVLGVVGTSALVYQPRAYAQQKKVQFWEYKIIFASTEHRDSATAITEQYNTLAAEGWEYLGPLVDSTVARSANASYSGINGVYVVFKRPK